MQAMAKPDPSLAKPAQQRAHTERWRPYRAYAAMHLWNDVAMEAGRSRGG